MLDAKERAMRTTVTIDDKLFAQAQAYTGIKEKSALLREAIKALVEREAARRLILLGGSDPDAEAAPRGRCEPVE
jgi:Arc/MetJ family transcription regulator